MSGRATPSIGRDTLAATIGRLVVMGAGFVTATIVARSLSVADTGLWFLIWSAAILAAGVAEVGAPMLAVRAVSISGGALPVRRLVSLVAAGSTAVTLLLGLASLVPGVGATLRLWWPVIGALAAALALERLTAEVLRGWSLIGWASSTSGATSRALTLAALLLWPLLTTAPLTLRAVMSISIAATVVSIGAGAFVAARRGPDTPRESLATAPVRLREALPLWGNRLANLVLGQADVLLVGLVATAAAAADYGIALRLSALVAIPLSIANAILPARIATMYAQGRHRALQRLLRASARRVLAIAVAVTVVLAAGSGWLISTTFGSEYFGAWPLLAILCAGQVASAFVASAGQLLIQAGQGGVLARITTASALTLVVGGAAAGAVGGATWVAVAASTALALQNWTAGRAAVRLLGLDPRASAALT